MTSLKTILLTAALAVGVPALAASHMEEKKSTAADPMATEAAPMDHGKMDHGKMDTTKMSKKDKAMHDKMIKDQMAKDKAAGQPK